jgi:hypothetical protein
MIAHPLGFTTVVGAIAVVAITSAVGTGIGNLIRAHPGEPHTQEVSEGDAAEDVPPWVAVLLEAWAAP